MFNIFAISRTAKVQIARDGDELLQKMKSLVAMRQEALDALGDRHHQVDLDLVLKIEALLSPQLGPSGASNESRWFQSMDWWGDGIRHLEFTPGAFSMSYIESLRALLTEEYLDFGILCWAPTESGYEGDSNGVVIFSDSLVLTPALASSQPRA